MILCVCVYVNKEVGKGFPRCFFHLGMHVQQPLRPSVRPSFPPSDRPHQNTKRCQQAGELLGGSLVSLHNVAFMNRLMAAIREVRGESMGPI